MAVNAPPSTTGLAATPVIVTDGETRTALACVRALGRRGVPVHVLAARSGALAAASRHCRQVHPVPDPEREPAAWGAAVRGIAAAVPGAALLPVTEVAMGNAFEQELDRHFRVCAPPRAAYEAAVDKHALLERAAACGLDVPRGALLERPSPETPLPEGQRYPVVVKARRSRWMAGGRWQRGGAVLVRDESAWRAALGRPDFAAGALVQEFVPGRGEGVFLALDRGRPVARFAHRRLREKPPSGGVSVLCESAAPDPRLAAGSERLLAALGWHGVAMVEFRRAPGGRAVVMEVNPRLWGSLQLAHDAGVDFAAIAVALACGAPVPAPEPRLGVRTRWLLGDLDHLWIAWRQPAMRAATGRSLAGLVLAFLRSFVDGTREEILRWDDPRPFAAALREWLRGAPAPDERALGIDAGSEGSVRSAGGGAG